MLYYVALGVGFVIGIAIYSRACYQHRVWPDLLAVIETPLFGSAGAAGIHLLICAVVPSELVHIADGKGAPAHLVGMTYQMDVFHRIHIAAGGLATLYIAAGGLRRFCKQAAGEATAGH